MVQYLKAWFDLHRAGEEEGQGLVEYALIIVLIAIVCIAALTTLGGQISTVFGDITAGLGG